MSKAQILFEEFQRIQQDRRSGVLQLSQVAHIVEISFRNGVAESVTSNLPDFRLGQYLLKEGFIDSPQLFKLLKRSRRRKSPVGETALRERLLEPQELSELVHRQALDLIGLGLQNGFHVNFEEGKPHNFSFTARLDSSSLLLDTARKIGRSSPHDFDFFQLTRREAIALLPWRPKEILVISHMGQPQTLETLAEETGLPAGELESTLGLLENLGFVEVLEGSPLETKAIVKRQPVPLELLIPEIKNVSYSQKLEVHRNESSFISEQFASLKVRLAEAELVRRRMQTIAISSAHMQDGKSLVSSNLALSMSRDPGCRVILVDCDLRRPSLHNYFGIPPQPGLIDYLNDDRLEPYCFIRRIGPLYIMTAGTAADTPIELLSHENMGTLMEYLSAHFDRILLDTAPLQPISDTRIVSRLADGIVLVIRQGKTPYRTVEKVLRDGDRDKLLGVVFNNVKAQLFHTYYDHRYYYGPPSHYPYHQGAEGNGFRQTRRKRR